MRGERDGKGARIHYTVSSSSSHQSAAPKAQFMTVRGLHARGRYFLNSLFEWMSTNSGPPCSRQVGRYLFHAIFRTLRFLLGSGLSHSTFSRCGECLPSHQVRYAQKRKLTLLGCLVLYQTWYPILSGQFILCVKARLLSANPRGGIRLRASKLA